MTERRNDAVDAFLADLGAADPSPDLAPSVMRRLRDERPSRATGVPGWLAAAAVLVAVVLALTGVAWIVAGPGPGPSPSAAPSARNDAAPTARPSATPSAAPSTAPSAAPSTAPSPGPTADLTWKDSWSITLAPNPRLTPVELMVLDYAGTMAGVAQATAAQSPDAGGLNDLVIGPGVGPKSITVGWVGGACDGPARLELAPDGRTLALRLSPRPSCDAIGIEFAVELRFKDPVDPATFHGSWSEDLVTPADVDAQAVAFADAQRGFVGGRTWGYATPVILETTDGGETWRVEGLGGIGDVTALGVAPDGRAWAGVACPPDLVQCRSGLYRYDEGSWGRVGDAWPVGLSFAGDVGAGLFAVPGGPVDDGGSPIAELRLMDAGEDWSTVATPCPTGRQANAASRIDTATVVVMCGSGVTQDSGAISLGTLYRSTDGGGSWSKLATVPYASAGLRMDLAAGGSGWMWPNARPILATTDGGITWAPIEVSAGDVRPVVDADYLGGGMGVALIRDPGRDQVLLRRAQDRRPWEELFAFPVICCGG